MDQDPTGGVITLRGDSDAAIVKGPDSGGVYPSMTG